MLDPIYRQAHNAGQIEHLFRPLATCEPTIHGDADRNTITTFCRRV